MTLRLAQAAVSELAQSDQFDALGRVDQPAPAATTANGAVASVGEEPSASFLVGAWIWAASRGIRSAARIAWNERPRAVHRDECFATIAILWAPSNPLPIAAESGHRVGMTP